jgi:hypothetical protein
LLPGIAVAMAFVFPTVVVGVMLYLAARSKGRDESSSDTVGDVEGR